jgi:hypothetical protein
LTLINKHLNRQADSDDNCHQAATTSFFTGGALHRTQVIIDKAKGCFSKLKRERGMMAVEFEQVELRCGVGPDIQWGRVIVVRVN